MCFFKDKTEQFKSSLATNDTSLDRVLLRKLEDITAPLADDKSQVFTYLIWLSPKPDDKDSRLMSIYLSADDLEKGKRTSGKPAKILRKILPIGSSVDFEAFAVWFKETYFLATQGLVLKSSKNRKDFARVYTMKQASASDPRLGCSRKSLAASCMRYSFDHLACHPTEIYGSGDFEIVWIENSQEQLLARAVICTRNGRYANAPIYTNSNLAADMLETEIANRKQACEQPDKATWINAELLRIENHNSDELIAPYFDNYSSAKDLGDKLKISKYGDLELTTTSGVISEYEYHCESCNTGLGEYDMHHAQDGTYCEDCFHDQFFYCEGCDEYEPNHNGNEVIGFEGLICEYCCHSGSGDIIHTTCGNYAHIDETVYSEHSDEWFLVNDENDTWFTSDVDGEVYSMDEKAELPTTAHMTHEQAIDSGHWLVVGKKSIVWKTRHRFYNPHSFNGIEGEGRHVENLERVYVLKPWLELHDCPLQGTIVVDNQLDLFAAA